MGWGTPVQQRARRASRHVSRRQGRKPPKWSLPKPKHTQPKRGLHGQRQQAINRAAQLRTRLLDLDVHNRNLFDTPALGARATSNLELASKLRKRKRRAETEAARLESVIHEKASVRAA